MLTTPKFWILSVVVIIASSVYAQSPSGSIMLERRLDSIASARGYVPTEVSVIADSALRSVVRERHTANPAAVLYVLRMESSGEPGNEQVLVHGMLIPIRPADAGSSFVFRMDSNPAEQIQIPPAARESDSESGFWSSVLQPTLVTLGAVAIIALFFFIRS